jgi:hypothetical protein
LNQNDFKLIISPDITPPVLPGSVSCFGVVTAS